jgi:hypothetical protein
MKRIACCAVTVALLFGSFHLPVQAQAPAGGYLAPLEMQPDFAERQKRQRAEQAYVRVMRGLSAFDSQGETDVRTWIEGFIVPAMTNPDHYAEIGEYRRDLMKNVAAAKSQDLHDFTVNLLFNAMRPLVEGNFPPPTRVNAMLLIAELNQNEMGSGVEMFTPHPMTLAYLRQQFSDPNQIDGVRVAALAGIHRHVEAQWWAAQPPAPDWIAGLKQEMLTVVNEVEPPAGRSPAAHAWFRGRATDVLGSLCGWAPDGA